MNENLAKLKGQVDACEVAMGQQSPPKDCFDGPCRETFHNRLQQAIVQAEKRLLALRQLEKIAKFVEKDSPLEELLWSMSSRLERY